MSPNRENGIQAYLAGAMEHAPDRGRGWREKVVPVLGDLGHAWFNPCTEEATLLSPEERSGFRAWKADGDDRFLPLMRRIIGHDIAALKASDYVICYWDEYARGSGGSASEVTLGYMWNKPVYLVRCTPRAELSAWIQGCASQIFDTLDELFTFLRQEYQP